MLRVRFRQALFAVMLLAARFKCHKSSVIGKFRFSGNVKLFSLVKCDMRYVSRPYGAALQKIVALPVILNVIYRSVEFPYNFPNNLSITRGD